MSALVKRLLAGAVLAGLSSGAMAQEKPAVAHVDPRPQYAALAKLPDWSGVWAPDWASNARNRGLTPKYTPAAAKLVEAFKKAQDNGENLQGQVANCVPPGVPGVMTQPYPIEFLYRPGAVYIITETYSQVRRVYTDGRPLPDDPDLWFNGHSVGKWEGDALIVETNGLNPRNDLGSGLHPTEATRVREKIWMEAPGKLVFETTITDPTLFTEPFVTRGHFARRDDWEMREYVCAENNKDAADPFGRPTMNLD